MLRRRRVRQGLSNGVQRELRSRAGTNTGRKDCIIGQMVNWRREGGARPEKHNSTVKDTVFNLLSSMHTIVLLLIYTCLWGLMKSTPVITDKESRPSKYTAQLFDFLIPSIKFLAPRLSQLEGRLAGNGCSLRSKFPHQMY